ncbi:MAG: hypothetical protein S4CHLAM20_04540 [Chlamydiia bacterium]|nr:hypothetical protein [Chlamydiia bacterium]
MEKSYAQVQRVMKSKGFKFFTGEMSINLIGIRKDESISNEFDDTLIVCIVMNGEPFITQFGNFTTEPGHYYLKEKFLNDLGCAILAPGQYRGMWKQGLHRGKYPALVQRGRCKVYRDSNRDECIDVVVERTGLFGINMHHAYDREKIGKYSAGCQVHSSPIALEAVLDLCKKSASRYGDSFTYTLLEEKDFE